MSYKEWEFNTSDIKDALDKHCFESVKDIFESQSTVELRGLSVVSKLSEDDDDRDIEKSRSLKSLIECEMAVMYCDSKSSAEKYKADLIEMIMGIPLFPFEGDFTDDE